MQEEAEKIAQAEAEKQQSAVMEAVNKSMVQTMGNLLQKFVGGQKDDNRGRPRSRDRDRDRDGDRDRRRDPRNDGGRQQKVYLAGGLARIQGIFGTSSSHQGSHDDH